jgi:hypothetical protein
MSGPQLVLAHASKIVMLALLAGMIWRGRLGQCWAFSGYVAAALTGNALVSISPERFYTPAFWMQKQAVYETLKFLIGLELAYRALSAFPGTWRTARVVFPCLLAITTLLLAWVTPRASYETVWSWQPSISAASVWALTGTALIVTWYGLPIGRWQRAIMLGLSPYMLTVSITWGLHRHGWTFEWAGRADSITWLALMTFWAYVAWRRDDTPESYPLEAVTADA